MAGIQSLYRFAVSQTREQFKQTTGVEAPPWDPNKPIKSWADPNPPDPDEEGNVRYLVLALAADKKTPAVQNGRPYLRTLTINRVEATLVNIPPKDFARDTRNVDPGSLSPMASIEVPVPCRQLNSDEELAFGFGGLVEVRRKQQEPTQGGSVTATDPEVKQLLFEVNSKLDILLAMSRQ